jgi:hypothetical protein
MYPGTTEDDYYQGRVTEASPEQQAHAMREAVESHVPGGTPDNNVPGGTPDNEAKP